MTDRPGEGAELDPAIDPGDVAAPAAEEPTGLRAAARHGGRWTIVESLVLQLLTAASTAVLARLLVPEDFGIVAITAVVTGFFNLITNVGFAASLIQRPRLTPTDVDTIFWGSAGIGAAMAAAGWLADDQIAAAFGEPRAAPFIAVASLSVLFGIASTVPKSLLLRRLRFRAFTLIGVASMVLQVTIAITLAAATDAGAWSIIVGQVARTVFGLAVSLLVVGYLPRLRFSWQAMKADLGFNLGYFGGSVGSYAVKNVDYWAVGRAYGDRTLGIYYVAYVLPNLVRQRAMWVFRRSLFPVLSKISGDRDRFVRAYLDVLRIVTLVSWPLLFGLALVTDWVVPLVFGGRYADAVAPMAIVAAASAFDALWQVVSVSLTASGMPGKAFVVMMGRLAVLLVGLGVAVQVGGLAAIAWAVFASAVATALVGQGMAVRRLGVPLRGILQAVAPVGTPVVAMGLAVTGMRWSLSGAGLPIAVELVMAVLVGGVAFAAILFLVHRSVWRLLMREVRSLVLPGAGRAEGP